jgi:hypothetical protein
MTSSTKEGPPSKLTYLIRLLDHVVKAVPAARYFWGVIAASVTVAIIGLLNGLNRLTFVAMVAAFGAMLIFYIFSRFEKASDPVIKLLVYGILIVAALGFIFVIVTSAWLSLTCTPLVLAYLYGVSEVCYGAPPRSDSRDALLRKFYQEYIISQDGLSPALLAGTEPVPADWMNKRLEQIGEAWRVRVKGSQYEIFSVNNP